MQIELDKGITLSELRNKILKGNIQSKVSKQLKTKKYFSIERVQRKKRDIMQLINKYAPETIIEKVVAPSKPPTVLDVISKAVEEQNGCVVLNKKVFKLDDKELLVRNLS